MLGLALTVLFLLGHPHREQRLLVIGDSISGARPYYDYKTWADGVALLSGAALTNEAVPGFTVQEMRAVYEAGPRERVDFCFFLGGVNNFWNSDDSAGALKTANSLLEEVRADGCRNMVLLRPTPWHSSPYWSQKRQEDLDALWDGLKSSWCDTGRARCFDTWQFLGSKGDPSAMEKPFDSGDGLHPNQLGQDVLTFAVLNFMGAAE